MFGNLPSPEAASLGASFFFAKSKTIYLPLRPLNIDNTLSWHLPRPAYAIITPMNNADEQNLDRVGNETNTNNNADSTVAEAEIAEVSTDTATEAESNDAEAPELHRVEQSFDIFTWANHMARIKNDLDIDLFLVNKHYTVYHLAAASELKPQIAPVFVLEILNDIEKGAGLGLEIREFEQSESEPGVLLYSTRKRVSNADHVLNVIEHERSSIENFNEYDHEFKTIKMIIAKCSHKDIEPFYICKQVSGSASLNERTAWEIGEDGKLQQFNAASAFKVPTDNQVLIVGGQKTEYGEDNQQIFAFAPKKFEAMFGYNYKKQAIADKRVEQILSRYRLNFPEGQDLNTMVAGKPKLINKLQNLELDTKTQEELVNYGEEMGLDLMTTDDGAIIIMDNKDIDTFVGLLNDDFMTSDLTGLKYEIKSKKLLEDRDTE